MYSVASIEQELFDLTSDLVFEEKQVFEEVVSTYLLSKNFYNYVVKFSHEQDGEKYAHRADIAFQLYDGSEVIKIPLEVSAEGVAL